MKQIDKVLGMIVVLTLSIVWAQQESEAETATVTLMAATEHGLPEGFEEESWLEATGAAFVASSAGGEDTIMVSASGLVPNGIYTLWWVIEEPEMSVGPAGGLPANTFTADALGNATTTVTATSDNDYQTLLMAYHADHRTYGDEPGQMGEVTFSQLMGPFPRSQTVTDTGQ